MRWKPRPGTKVLAKYPEEIDITDMTLMQVYSTHEYSGEPGMISLVVGSLNIASYYTGPETSFYIILLLNIGDDPDAYEGGFPDVSRIILQCYEEGTLSQMMPSLYQRLSIYPSLNEEQLLAMTYQDDTNRIIINRLREEGVITKSELMVWLKDQFKLGFADIDSVINELIKRELIKGESFKGIPSELIFLTNDILMSRVPPDNLIGNPEKVGLPGNLSNDYVLACKQYFQRYRLSEEDNLKIINLLINPQVYEVLRLLRTAIVTRNDLEKLKKKGVDDVDETLKLLWDAQMIQVFQDSRGNEYYALLTDFNLDLIFPKYSLNIIKEKYDLKTKSSQMLVEYLHVLEDVYTDLKSKAKAKE